MSTSTLSRRLSGALLAIGLATFGGFFPIASTSPAGASTNNGALVVKAGQCSLTDGNGDVVPGTSFHAVANQGVANMTCSANVAPSSTGHAVKYQGFGCGWNAPNGILYVTANSSETVSATGHAKLVCTNMTPS